MHKTPVSQIRIRLAGMHLPAHSTSIKNGVSIQNTNGAGIMLLPTGSKACGEPALILK